MSNDCHEFRGRMADLVAGILPEPDRRKLQEHMGICVSCRDYLQALRQEDARLTQYFAGLDEDMGHRQERALQMIECSGTNRKRNTASIWRQIMNSPFSKLATAAVVVVVAAVTMVVLDQSASSAYAISDLSAAFDQASVIHVAGWHYFPERRLNDGTPIPPVPIDSWIDLESGRIRQTQVSLGQSVRMRSQGVPVSDTTFTVTEMICDGAYQMTLDHTARTATFTRISEYGRQWMAYQQSRLLWGQLCGQPTQLEAFVNAGREDIDGRTYDVWQLDATGGMGGIVGGGGGGGGGWGGAGGSAGVAHVAMTMPSLRSRLWIAADSGRLGRAQVLSRVGDGRWQLQQDFRTIDYDVKIPEGTFSTEPPAGYTITNSKETAPMRELPGSMVRCGSLDCTVRMSFTLDDGSVVIAWQSSDRATEESQEPLFADLTFGGPLPKLPIELHGLKPAGAPERMAYTACHLAYTSKAGQFTEWALYVPEITPPADVKYRGYDVLYQFNVATPPNGGMGINVGYGVPVDTAEDFEKWVRGAMAEFCDDATAPTDVTYQRVIDLARQVRTSVTSQP